MTQTKPTTKPTTRATPGTGSVYEDAKRPGSFIGQARVNGRKVNVRGKSKMEAREKLNAKLAELRAGRLPEPAATAAGDSPTVATVAAEWLERELPGRDLAPSTDHQHRWAAALWVEAVGHRPVDQLTVAQVEDALVELMVENAKKPRGRATLEKIRQTLRQILTYAQRRGHVATNVAAVAIVPADAARPVPREALDPAEARALLDQLEHAPRGAMFATSLLIGLRPGEAAGLFWSDVDLDAGVLTVNRGVQRRPVGPSSISDDLKVESARRSIQMPADLVRRFKDYRRNADVVTLDGLIFHDGAGRPLPQSRLMTELAAACEAAGIRVAKPNELRHSCASLLIDNGVAIERVADLLGHTSTRMVDMVYRHRVRPVVDAAAAVSWADAK